MVQDIRLINKHINFQKLVINKPFKNLDFNPSVIYLIHASIYF